MTWKLPWKRMIFQFAMLNYQRVNPITSHKKTHKDPIKIPLSKHLPWLMELTQLPCRKSPGRQDASGLMRSTLASVFEGGRDSRTDGWHGCYGNFAINKAILHIYIYIHIYVYIYMYVYTWIYTHVIYCWLCSGELATNPQWVNQLFLWSIFTIAMWVSNRGHVNVGLWSPWTSSFYP